MKSVTVHVPATTANLGPGFDTLGLALDLWNETEFTQNGSGKLTLSISGEGEKTLPTDENNAIAAAALQVFALVGKDPAGLTICCTNHIPLISGMGSSSAALLTGMLGANALLGEPLARQDILSMATENEGHPDKVVPAMLGGLVASVLRGRVGPVPWRFREPDPA